MASFSPWHLLRNPYTRAAYDALARRGVKLSKMYLYGVDLAEIGAHAGESPASATETDIDGITVDVRTPAEVTAPPTQDEDALAADDAVVVAVADGDPVGFQTLSLDRAVYVSPVEREITSPAFLWGLYVAPRYRNRGVATALIRRALALARERGADDARTLVAVDNSLSKRALTSNGFEPRCELSYYRLGPFEKRVDRSL